MRVIQRLLDAVTRANTAAPAAPAVPVAIDQATGRVTGGWGAHGSPASPHSAESTFGDASASQHRGVDGPSRGGFSVRDRLSTKAAFDQFDYLSRIANSRALDDALVRVQALVSKVEGGTVRLSQGEGADLEGLQRFVHQAVNSVNDARKALEDRVGTAGIGDDERQALLDYANDLHGVLMRGHDDAAKAASKTAGAAGLQGTAVQGRSGELGAERPGSAEPANPGVAAAPGTASAPTSNQAPDQAMSHPAQDTAVRSVADASGRSKPVESTGPAAAVDEPDNPYDSFSWDVDGRTMLREDWHPVLSELWRGRGVREIDAKAVEDCAFRKGGMGIQDGTAEEVAGALKRAKTPAEFERLVIQALYDRH